MAYRFTRPAMMALMAGVAASGQAFAAQAECSARAMEIARSIVPGLSVSGEMIRTLDGRTIILPDDTAIGAEPYAMVCRNWPARPDLLLVALPLIAERSDDLTQGDLGLYVLASDTLEIIASTTLDDMMMEDAIRIDGLAFDTAQYRLASDRMAFGVRLSQRGSSRVNPFATTTLWLFEHRDGAIATILDNVVVKASGGEWDGICAGDFWSAESFLAMTEAVQNGVYGINVMVREDITATDMRDGECETVKSSALDTSVSLVFDGVAYDVPEPLSRGW